MIFLKQFHAHSEYQEFIVSEEYVKPNVSYCEAENDAHYNPLTNADKYLTFIIKTGGNIKFSGSTASNALYYSKNNGEWTYATSATVISVAAGDKIMWKGYCSPYINYRKGIGSFSGDTNVRYDVEGNVMSLLYNDNFKGVTDLTGKNYAFRDLFSGCTNVISAKNMSLPATTLASNCYRSMFDSCRNLTTAPELPATTLADSCYYQMFSGCGNLTTAPELPATTLVSECYYDMFYYCSSLKNITCLATSIPSTNCTYTWVTNVAANGTFTKAASMTSWTTGTSGIPNGWTVQDA